MTLECENCGFEARSRACSACRERVPAWAKFCPMCGAGLGAEAAPSEIAGDPFSMENRRLCPDGNCIGILDAESRCVVCGKNG